jgi:hypothetical protein
MSLYNNARRKLDVINAKKEAGEYFNQNYSFGNDTEDKAGPVKIKSLYGNVGIYQNKVIGTKGVCFYCEEKKHTNKDHFVPRSVGGVLIVISCIDCNSRKSNLNPFMWIQLVKIADYPAAKKEKIISNTEKLIDVIIESKLDGYIFFYVNK